MPPLTETTAMITSFTKNINIFLLYHPELDIKLKFMRMLYNPVSEGDMGERHLYTDAFSL